MSLPDYSGVIAKNLPDAERDSNLQMLKFISDECARRGLQFQLGLWSHAYAYGPGANYPIEGLTEANHAAYCRDALASILKTLPRYYRSHVPRSRRERHSHGKLYFLESGL